MKLFQSKNLALLTIFLIPSYLIKVTILNIPTNLLELLATFTFLLVLFSKRKDVINKFKNIPFSFLFSVLLIIIGLLASILSNNEWRVGFGILKGWFIIPILFSFGLFISLDSINSLEKIFKSIFFSSVIVSIIAICYKSLGLVTYDNRLSAIYLSPNHLAMYLTPGIIFGLYFIKNKRNEVNWLYLFATFLLIISLYFTYSYGSWIAVIFSILFAVFMDKKVRLNHILIGIILVLTLFFSQISSEKLNTLTKNASNSSLYSRIIIWNVSANLIKENPVWGISPGNFQNSYLSKQVYYPPFLEWAVPQPHNIFLAFWLQSGIIGFIGFLIIICFIFKKLLCLLKNKESAALAAPLLAFFVYTLLHGLVDTTYWKNDYSFLFWIAAFSIIFLLTYSHEKKDMSL